MKRIHSKLPNQVLMHTFSKQVSNYTSAPKVFQIPIFLHGKNNHHLRSKPSARLNETPGMHHCLINHTPFETFIQGPTILGKGIAGRPRGSFQDDSSMDTHHTQPACPISQVLPVGEDGWTSCHRRPSAPRPAPRPPPSPGGPGGQGAAQPNTVRLVLASAISIAAVWSACWWIKWGKVTPRRFVLS